MPGEAVNPKSYPLADAQLSISDSGSGFNVRALILLLPVLVILLLNILPSLDPVYSFSRSYPYDHRYTTGNGVNFYVKSSARFERDYPIDGQKWVALEGKIERDYESLITQKCRIELQRMQWGSVKEAPHCEMLKQFQSWAPSAA
ncbi:unnamed protein product [Linum trigynum]|uniref:DUF1977 domain-containing protein n=1 Tax=Linum trigynum TaxID=586398 RepID=A0AAV2GW10_9ROSI